MGHWIKAIRRLIASQLKARKDGIFNGYLFKTYTLFLILQIKKDCISFKKVSIEYHTFPWF